MSTVKKVNMHEPVGPLGLRLMQLSFRRDAAQHADNMLRAGRYFLQPPTRRHPILFLIATLLFGVMIGGGFEYYRRYALAPYFNVQELPPAEILLLEILPIVLVLAAGFATQRQLKTRARRKALIASLASDVMIDIDVHENGMVVSRDGETTTYDWSAFRKIETAKGWLVFHQDDRLIFVPQRAFKNAAAFNTQSREILNLWNEDHRAKIAGSNQNSSSLSA